MLQRLSQMKFFSHLTTHFFFVALLFTLTRCEIVHKDVSMHSLRAKNRFVYISKYGCEKGSCKAVIQAKFKKPWVRPSVTTHYNVLIGRITDRYLFRIQEKNQTCQKKKTSMEQVMALMVPTDGSLSKPITLNRNQNQRDLEAYMYYYLMECDKKLETYYANEPQTLADIQQNTIQLTITLTNDNEHLSSHHTEIRPILVLLLLVKLCIAYYVYTEYNKSTVAHAKTDYPLYVLLFALLSSSFNSLIMLVHYSLINSNGYSPVIFQVLGSVGQMAAQVALGILLVLLSQGYTVKFQDIEHYNDALLPLFFLLSMLLLIFECLAFLFQHQENNVHNDFTVAGVINGVIIMGMGVVFAYYVKILEERYEAFKQSLIVGGLWWWGGRLCIWLYAWSCPDIMKWKILTYGTTVLELGLVIWFLYIFTGKSGYTKASYKNQSILDNKFQ